MLSLHHPQRRIRPRESELGRDCAVAAALLGDRHPLTTVLARLAANRAQLVMIAALHVAGLALWWANVPSGTGLVVAAVATEVVLGCRMLLLLDERASTCRDLIAEGREDLPLGAVARARTRLAAPKRQEQLARTLLGVLPLECRWARQATARAPVDARVTRQVAGELQQVSRLMRARPVSARCAALVEQLVSSPTSPLYGDDVDRLRRELGRVRFLA
jgi:hypothetical protein